MTEQDPGRAAADSDSTGTFLRSPAERSRTFTGILVNTALANITTSYLWFALTFWLYLETRNVIATGVVGGAYMLLIALSSISFGTFVDRCRKLAVMRFAACFTLVMFVLSGVMFLLVPAASLLDLGQAWFWIFTLVILVGAVVENLRNIALSTTVTILIEPERRANANGLVGMVQGLMFIVTSLLSGLSVGLLGMGWTIAVALVLTALAFAHLLTLRMPEEVRPAATDARGGFDLRGSIAAVLAISGLFALILFSTFNNFIGGVYMALMDPYGLEMFSVQMWGAVFAVGSTGFIIGGALIGKFGLGANPLRTLLVAVAAMGVLGAVFTLREWRGSTSWGSDCTWCWSRSWRRPSRPSSNGWCRWSGRGAFLASPWHSSPLPHRSPRSSSRPLPSFGSSRTHGQRKVQPDWTRCLAGAPPAESPWFSWWPASS